MGFLRQVKLFVTNEWLSFKGVLDSETCNKIIDQSNGNFISPYVNRRSQITEKEILDGKLQYDYGEDALLRKGGVCWINEKWINDIVWKYMFEANERSGWKFDIAGIAIPQLSKYKKGDFYSLHNDGAGDNNSETHDGMVRKLSMSVLLNEGYEGGEFMFENDYVPDIGGIGSILIFPSCKPHRVAPVTKGTRYSLVVWFVGPPFR